MDLPVVRYALLPRPPKESGQGHEWQQCNRFGQSNRRVGCLDNCSYSDDQPLSPPAADLLAGESKIATS